MTSEKQTQANRRNALKSTGPRTPEGKVKVRSNAIKHGVLSQEVLLRREDEEAFQELDENLRVELQPVGELENMLVDRIVAARWRLRRLGRVETGIFEFEISVISSTSIAGKPDTTALGLSFIGDGGGANAFSKLSRYETAIERSLYRALHELQRLQAVRQAEDVVLPPVAVDVDVSGVPGEDL